MLYPPSGWCRRICRDLTLAHHGESPAEHAGAQDRSRSLSGVLLGSKSNNLCRNTRHNGILRDIPSHNRPGPDDSALSDRGTAQNRDSGPQPDILANPGRQERVRLAPDNSGSRGKRVLGGEYPAVHGDERMVTDRHSPVAIDHAVRTDEDMLTHVNRAPPGVELHAGFYPAGLTDLNRSAFRAVPAQSGDDALAQAQGPAHPAARPFEPDGAQKVQKRRKASLHLPKTMANLSALVEAVTCIRDRCLTVFVGFGL